MLLLIQRPQRLKVKKFIYIYIYIYIYKESSSRCIKQAAEAKDLTNFSEEQ